MPLTPEDRQRRETTLLLLERTKALHGKLDDVIGEAVKEGCFTIRDVVRALFSCAGGWAGMVPDDVLREQLLKDASEIFLLAKDARFVRMMEEKDFVTARAEALLARDDARLLLMQDDAVPRLNR